MRLAPTYESISADNENVQDYTSLRNFFSKRDLASIAFACLVGDMSRGLFFPTIWLLVQRLGGQMSDQGFAIAMFSTGRILTSPLFGIISEKCGYRAALIIANCLIIVGCILYINANSLLMLFAAQLTIGFGSGTLGVTRSYTVNATSRKNRTIYMAYLTAVQFAAFTVMPFFGSLLSFLGNKYASAYPLTSFINQFSLPAIFVALSALCCCFLVHAFVVEDTGDLGSMQTVDDLAIGGGSPVRTRDVLTHRSRKLESKEMVQTGVRSSSNMQSWDNRENDSVSCNADLVNVNIAEHNVFLIIAGGCLMNMTTKGTIGVFETLCSEYVSHTYRWSALQTGTFFASCGAIGVLFLLNFERLVYLIGDYNLMVYGVCIMAVSCIILALAPAVPQTLFVTAIIFMYCLGYPVGHTALLGNYSKIMKRGKQGFILGIFASAGSIARVIFPILCGIVTQRSSESVAFGFMGVILVLSVCLFVAHRDVILDMTSGG